MQQKKGVQRHEGAENRRQEKGRGVNSRERSRRRRRRRRRREEAQNGYN
jgi:hypothetical protein